MIRFAVAFAFLSALVIGANPILAVGPNVIYSEVVSSPTSSVPGALGAGGVPVATNWLAIEDLSLRHDGGQWMLKGRTTQATTNDSILLLGGGFSGTMFAQDGQPVLGGAAGEQYDFFDSPVPAAWDSVGNIAFSFRAKGGTSTRAEKIVRVVGGVHTMSIQQDDPALGLIDAAPNPSGDERFGNSMNSVHLLNDGRVGFVNTPITNVSPTRYPAFFRGNTSFRQSGVSPIGGETWDSFVLDGAGGTPDGAHWFARGDTENPDTTVDGVFVVDDTVIVREGSLVPGSSVVAADTFFGRMLSNGDYFARGDDPADNDWALRNGTFVTKTGDMIVPGENWGNAFSTFTGNRIGQWLLIGNTDIGDANRDNVMVFNGGSGNMILTREGDPIDLDNNGLFDDNVFLASFQPNDAHLTDDGHVYFLVTLRDGAGTGVGDAFLHLVVPEPTTLVLLALAAAGLRRRSR